MREAAAANATQKGRQQKVRCRTATTTQDRSQPCGAGCAHNASSTPRWSRLCNINASRRLGRSALVAGSEAPQDAHTAAVVPWGDTETITTDVHCAARALASSVRIMYRESCDVLVQGFGCRGKQHRRPLRRPFTPGFVVANVRKRMVRHFENRDQRTGREAKHEQKTSHLPLLYHARCDTRTPTHAFAAAHATHVAPVAAHRAQS